MNTQHELWIGKTDDCLNAAHKAGLRTRPRIIHSPDKLEGYKGPLTIHLCGLYSDLHEWNRINDALNRLKVFEEITIIYH